MSKSEQITKSCEQSAANLNSLPISVLVVNLHGRFVYVDQKLMDMTGLVESELNAEGIDSDNQEIFMHPLEIDTMQGFKYCKPLPTDKNIEWYKIHGNGVV